MLKFCSLIKVNTSFSEELLSGTDEIITKHKYFYTDKNTHKCENKVSYFF